VKPVATPARYARAALGIALGALPATASAHLVTTGVGPVYDGIAHFVVTFEDLIPVIAMTIYAAQRGREQARDVILVLSAAWLAAGALAVSQDPLTVLRLGWLPFVVLGALVAADLRLPRVVVTLLAALLGALLGYASGAAMSGAGPGLRGVLGASAALFVVATLVAAAVVSLQHGWLRIAWRVLGSWIAASGLLLLGWSFVA
jgi:hydrogenase/urease accessory protein HupE